MRRACGSHLIVRQFRAQGLGARMDSSSPYHQLPCPLSPVPPAPSSSSCFLKLGRKIQTPSPQRKPFPVPSTPILHRSMPVCAVAPRSYSSAVACLCRQCCRILRSFRSADRTPLDLVALQSSSYHYVINRLMMKSKPRARPVSPGSKRPACPLAQSLRPGFRPGDDRPRRRLPA